MLRPSRLLLQTSCLFLCLGGWGYSSQAIAADPASGAATTEPANLNTSVVNVSPEGIMERVTFSDTDINTVLQFLAQRMSKNIVASPEVKGNVTAALYNVTFEQALDAILTPLRLGYQVKGNFIYVYSAKELEEIKKSERKAVNHIFRLHYIAAADAAILIKPMLSPTGQVALTPAATSDISDAQTDADGDSYGTDDTLVVNDYPDNIADIEKALKQIDVRPKQVLIEATILRASLTEDNAMGIDLVSLSGINFSSLASGSITNNVYQAFQNGTTGSGSTITGTKAVAGTDFASSVPQGGLSVGFLSNSINVFLRALETTTDVTVVANPKILAVNKHRGEVFIGNHSGYITTTVSQTTSTQTVEFLDTGTKLIFRPFIGDDGYVRLEVHPEDSAGAVTNGLPDSTSTEVTSNIMVKDGRTVVIGGLFREQTTADRGQVPVIGDIPILGIPFRRTADDTQRSETIILLTPHIINDDTSFYAESEKRQEDVTRMMLGNRTGLQPWGRDRLAQCWYEHAETALEKGDRQKAIMFTDWALNTQPNMLEAIKLREQLTNTRLHEADENSLHDFVRNVIWKDRNEPVNQGGGHYPPEPAADGGPQVPATAPATEPAK